MTWTAEITNDPTRDFELYIELLENDHFRGRVVRRDGQLVLALYDGEAVEMPAKWLVRLLESAEHDL